MYKKGWKNNSTPTTTLALIDMYLIFIPIFWKIGKQAWFWFLVTKQDFDIYHENIIVSLNCSFQNVASTIVSWLNTIQCIKILCFIEILLLKRKCHKTRQSCFVTMYFSENWSLQVKEGEPLVVTCYHDSNQWSLTKVVGG